MTRKHDLCANFQQVRFFSDFFMNVILITRTLSQQDYFQILPSLKFSFEMVKILGKSKFEKILTLESLFISEIKPALNTKDEFKSRIYC